jgi:RNA polymerase-binding transcription factor DksA
MALNHEQIRQLRNTVENRRSALIEELRDDIDRVRQDRFRDLAGPAPDAGDESVALLIADLDHAEVGRDVEELRSLEGARARLRDGTYGTCVECGGDIGFARLQASPAALRCVECQRMYEKTHAGTSGSSL